MEVLTKLDAHTDTCWNLQEVRVEVLTHADTCWNLQEVKVEVLTKLVLRDTDPSAPQAALTPAQASDMIANTGYLGYRKGFFFLFFFFPGCFTASSVV